MSDREREYYHSITERFSTVQGFSLRQEVESISNDEMLIKDMKLSDLKTARKTIAKIEGKEPD